MLAYIPLLVIGFVFVVTVLAVATRRSWPAEHGPRLDAPSYRDRFDREWRDGARLA